MTKRIFAGLLAAVFVFSALAFNVAEVSASERRTIRIGTWWDMFYDSTHQDIADDPAITNAFTAQMRLDRVREIEEAHNVYIQFYNLTWYGVIESINTSIMAGMPDMDVYMVDLQFGVPAVLNGFALPLQSFLYPEHDVLNEMYHMRHLNILGQEEDFLFAQQSSLVTGYPLGFNLTMILEAGLEDPRDVFERGEWTWDVWRDYLLALTRHLPDGTTIYGYGGYWTNLLTQMLLSNNAGIANSPEQSLTSPATIEVLEFIFQMYNIDNTARPWDDTDWQANMRSYADGVIGFWMTTHWMLQEFGGADLPFEIGVVPWPHGPSGTPESSMYTNIAGNWLFIPVGTEDPELVFNVISDWYHWYDGTFWLRDDTEWEENMFMTERNYEMAQIQSTYAAFDLWQTLGLGDDFSLIPIMDGEATPAQFAEEHRLIIQNALDVFFGGN